MKKWLLILSLLLFLLGCKLQELQTSPQPEQQKIVITKDLIVNELERNKHTLSFTIQK